MKHKKTQYVLALCAGSLTACLMGGGSDQPNRIEETLSGYVSGGDGKPMVSARVRLYAGSYRTGTDIGLAPSEARLDTQVVTDVTGTYALRPFTGAHFVEVVSADSGMTMVRDNPQPDSGTRKLADIPLSEGASLLGILISSARVVELHLAGTHFHAVQDDSGRFRFPLLPPGNYRLVAKLGPEYDDQLVSVDTVSLEAGEKRDLDSVFFDPHQIPLFNFDSSDPVSLLRGLSFASPDDTSRVGAWAPRPLNVESVGAYSMGSLHIQVNAGENAGFALGEGYYDLSKMAAFVFRGKGSGKIQVQFYSRLAAFGEPSLRAEITLGPDWKEYRVTGSDIFLPDNLQPAGKHYTWEAAKDAISKIMFLADGGDADLWLDDMRIEGMRYTDLGQAMPAGDDAFP